MNTQKTKNTMNLPKFDRFSNGITISHKLQDIHTPEDDPIRAFLNQKLPRKHASQKLMEAIREKIKAIR